MAQFPPTHGLEFSKEFYQGAFGMTGSSMVLRSAAKKMRLNPKFFPTVDQFVDSCKTQTFSLPRPIMEYIANNPSSPDVYEKLIKCCKWFFAKNPRIVAKRMRNKCICNYGACSLFDRCMYCIKMDAKFLNTKLWITGDFVVNPLWRNSALEALEICSNVCVIFKKDCFIGNLNKFQLVHTSMSLDGVAYFAASAKYVHLHYTRIYNEDETVSRFADIMDALKSVEQMTFHCSTQNMKVFDKLEFKKLLEHVQTGKLRCLEIHDIPVAMDITELSKFLRVFCLHGKIRLSFDCDKIGEIFKAKIDQLVNALIADNVKKCLVHYVGMSKFYEMYKLYSS